MLHPPRDAAGHRVFGPAEMRDIKIVQLLRQCGLPLPQIGPVLDDLRRTGGPGPLRDAVARRRAELTRRAEAMLEGAAALHRYLTERATAR